MLHPFVKAWPDPVFLHPVIFGLFFLCLSHPLAAGVFGDGDPVNGPEDDRLGISVGGHPAPASDWYRGSGTLICDGAVRGSATLLDVSRQAPGLRGVVIATAAHVLYDLERQVPWDECRFAFMGLGQLPGYSARLISDYQVAGDFHPAAAPSDPQQGEGDWAFLWLGPQWEPPPPWYGFNLGDPETVSEDHSPTAELGLVAWDRGRGEVSVTSGCLAIHSRRDDIGGGAWPGQLLDNCDSDLGASGGGLVSHDGVSSQLVAIRGGAHWDMLMWPPGEFPEGPPHGSLWSPDHFTNYARRLDETILETLEQWLRLLPDS